jgi:DNA-binding HxlR family transcriptional regulator
VARRVVAETPVRVEYHLTDKGVALVDAVAALSAWAETWVAPEQAHARPQVDDLASSTGT